MRRSRGGVAILVLGAASTACGSSQHDDKPNLSDLIGNRNFAYFRATETAGSEGTSETTANLDDCALKVGWGPATSGVIQLTSLATTSCDAADLETGRMLFTRERVTAYAKEPPPADAARSVRVSVHFPGEDDLTNFSIDSKPAAQPAQEMVDYLRHLQAKYRKSE